MRNTRSVEKKLELKRDISLLTWYERDFLDQVMANGGFHNAHGHLCRAHTLHPKYLRHYGTTPLAASLMTLKAKQDLVGEYHKGPAYTEEDLRERMSMCLERLIALGTTRFDTNIDATPDLPEGGLLAIRVALELKEKFKKKGLTLNIAPTPIFGFKKDPKHERSRWKVFEEAAKMSDYLSLLPEKDYPLERTPEGRIGFKQHARKGLELARKLGKVAEFHVDQMNTSSEQGSEWILDVLDTLDYIPPGEHPMVWFIHMISPSAYPEERFKRLVDRLLEHNVGVKVCSIAALSMRQLRSTLGPIHNSIARVPELIKMRVPVLFGSDNIEDAFDPQGNGDMLQEVLLADISLRMNLPSVLAKLAAGKPLTNTDVNAVGDMLYKDREACIAINPTWDPAIK